MTWVHTCAASRPVGAERLSFCTRAWVLVGTYPSLTRSNDDDVSPPQSPALHCASGVVEEVGGARRSGCTAGRSADLNRHGSLTWAEGNTGPHVRGPSWRRVAPYDLRCPRGCDDARHACARRRRAPSGRERG